MGIIDIQVNYCPSCGIAKQGNNLNLNSIMVKKGFLHGEFIVTEFGCDSCKASGYLTVKEENAV